MKNDDCLSGLINRAAPRFCLFVIWLATFNIGQNIIASEYEIKPSELMRKEYLEACVENPSFIGHRISAWFRLKPRLSLLEYECLTQTIRAEKFQELNKNYFITKQIDTEFRKAFGKLPKTYDWRDQLSPLIDDPNEFNDTLFNLEIKKQDIKIITPEGYKTISGAKRDNR